MADESFEQQVGAALRTGAPCLVLEDYWYVFDRIARRVALAIEAAADAASSNATLTAHAAMEGFTVTNDQLENWVEAALAVLRGKDA